jgi:hypothetical protein
VWKGWKCQTGWNGWRRYDYDEEEESKSEGDEEETSKNESSSKPKSTTPSPVEPTEKGSSEIKDEIDALSSTCDSNEGVKEMAYPGDDEFKTTEWIDRYDDRHPFDDTLNIDLDNDLVGVSVDHQLGKNMNTLELKVSIWRTGITPLS